MHIFDNIARHEQAMRMRTWRQTCRTLYAEACGHLTVQIVVGCTRTLGEYRSPPRWRIRSQFRSGDPESWSGSGLLPKFNGNFLV